MRRNRPVLIIALLAVGLSVLLSWLYFRFSYFEADTTSYLFQAKLFAEGKLSMPSPPEHGFSSSPHINILNGKWYSKYPFGNALMLMFGVFINAPWLIPALATGGALFLLFLLVKEMHGRPVALIALLLGLISPATLGMGSTWFSEPVSRFFLALYLYALIRTLNGKGGIGYPLISGFALGYAFNTRPLTAVVFGIVGAGLTLFQLFSQRRANTSLKLATRMGLFLIPLLLMVGVSIAWNAYFTGDAFTFTEMAAQPYNGIGFGIRGDGYEPDLTAGVFTPAWAIERTWRHILPCISYNALGWGSYSHNLLAGFNLSIRWFIAFVPLVLPWALALLPFFGIATRGRSYPNRYDWLCLALVLGNLLAYAFFFFDGSTIGFTPVHARYYNESTLLAFIPLVARGMALVYERFEALRARRARLSRHWGLAGGVCLLLLTVNTVRSYVRIAPFYQDWHPVYQKLPRLVAEQDIHNAIIFVSDFRGAPIGDYPFQSLDEADIVYFKLGPLKQWKLTDSDWQHVYAQYFTGRDAYLYVPNENRLQLLSVP